MSQPANKFKGIFTALITPFDSVGEIDWATYETFIDRQIKAGVSGVVPVGTTAESPTLSKAEKQELIGRAIDQCQGTPLKVIAGTGSNNTHESVEASRWASERGADGVLAVTPYYNKPTQEGLRQHFTQIADAVDCEVVLYNIPGRSVIAIAPETLVTLAKHPRMGSIKEATGDPALASRIFSTARREGTSLDLLSGDDLTFLSYMAVGATGTISVASNVLPGAMIRLYDAAYAGKYDEALAIHNDLFDFFEMLFVEPNPIPTKAALAKMGLGSDRVRLPLTPLSDGGQKKLFAVMDRLRETSSGAEL